MIFLLEGAYHGSQADFLVAIEPLLSALEMVGGLQADIRGTGTHSLGWLDSLLYANNNDLFDVQGTGETLESPLNYTAVSWSQPLLIVASIRSYGILLTHKLLAFDIREFT